MSVIDVHAHALPEGFLSELAGGQERFPHVEARRGAGGVSLTFSGGAPTRPVAAGLTETGKRAAWLAGQGIDVQVIGGWLDAFGYELPGDEGADWSAALTGAINDLAAGDDALMPLGTVPLQDPERAATALHDQCAAVGSRRPGEGRGVMIGTRAGGLELDDPVFTPFWEVADDTGAVIFLHPAFGAASPRYAEFGLVNGLARLEDSTVTVARLLYAGIPARFPRMSLVVAHGGAALPYVLGRLVRNHLLDPGGTADPLESFARLYFDSVVFDPAALEFLVTKAGPDRVLLGSDYPFPIGDLTPRAVVENAALDDKAHDSILGGNAARLFAPRLLPPPPATNRVDYAVDPARTGAATHSSRLQGGDAEPPRRSQ
jgi:aminocarboxymuconate-semialdehyde decarboxylase